jgi:solute carrier family 25 phosphate transporter 3
MPPLFPSGDTLNDSFHSAVHLSPRPSPPSSNEWSSASPKAISQPARSELYTAWSVVDDAKSKANALSAEAAKEFDKASAAAQAKVGGIELYSARYYAACTFGGLLACVSIWIYRDLIRLSPSNQCLRLDITARMPRLLGARYRVRLS